MLCYSSSAITLDKNKSIQSIKHSLFIDYINLYLLHSFEYFTLIATHYHSFTFTFIHYQSLSSIVIIKNYFFWLSTETKDVRCGLVFQHDYQKWNNGKGKLDGNNQDRNESCLGFELEKTEKNKHFEKNVIEFNRKKECQKNA
jgi:hypothetical protein